MPLCTMSTALGGSASGPANRGKAKIAGIPAPCAHAAARRCSAKENCAGTLRRSGTEDVASKQHVVRALFSMKASILAV